MLQTLFHRTLPLALVCALLAAVLPGQPAKLSAAGDNVGDLIRQLDSGDFREREKATRILVECKAAEPALQRALEHAGSEEVRRRIGQILKQRGQRRMRARVERLKDAVAKCALPQIPPLLAGWPKGFEEDACWAEMEKLAAALVDRDTKANGKLLEAVLGRTLPLKPMVTRRHDVIVSDRITRLAGKDVNYPVFIRAREVAFVRRQPSVGVIACSGPVHVQDFLGRLIVASGPVVVDGARGAIIVSDSDVKVQDADKCLIIARGNVACYGGLSECHIFTGKRLVQKHSGLSRCLVSDLEGMPLGLRNYLKVDGEDLGCYVGPRIVKRGNEIEYITGPDVSAREGGILVGRIEPGSAWERAGLRWKDKILAVNGNAVDSIAELRRLVCGSLLRDDGLTIRVERNGKTREVWLETPW